MKGKQNCLRWGLTAFLTVCAILVFYDTFFLSGTLQKFFSKLMGILAPILYGCGMAYLLAPVVNFLEQKLLRGLTAGKYKKGRSWARAISIFLTWAVVGFLFYILMNILIPQLANSVKNLVDNAELYYGKIYDWFNHLLDNNPDVESWALKQVNTYYQDIVNYLSQHLLPQAQQMVTLITGGIWGVVKFGLNLIVGIIVSVYLLAMKEKSAARCCKLVYGIFKEETAYWIVRGTRRADRIFSGFVRGKLLDSLIIGILCFIGCSLLHLPYTPLISVIVGVTNVIPFFGPFLGAIPSAFLILLVSPLQCLYFVLFIIGLQQLDGNVIGPMILGDSTGLSSFWVVVAILVGGGFWGVLGMFLGVPAFACVYTLVRFLIDRRLARRHMPVEAHVYVHRDEEIHPPEPGTVPPGETPPDSSK